MSLPNLGAIGDYYSCKMDVSRICVSPCVLFRSVLVSIIRIYVFIFLVVASWPRSGALWSRLGLDLAICCLSEPDHVSPLSCENFPSVRVRHRVPR